MKRRFFKRFPLDMPDDVDPTPEELAAVDDNTPEPEPVVPDQEKMSEDEYQVAFNDMMDRRKRIAYRCGVSRDSCDTRPRCCSTSSPANQTVAGLPVHEGQRHRPSEASQ